MTNIRFKRAAITRVDRRLATISTRARLELFQQRARLAAARVGSDVTLDISARAHIPWSTVIEVFPGTVSHLAIGDNTRIGEQVKFSLRGGTLRIGAGTDVRRFGTYHVGGDLTIGSGCVLSTGLQVHCARSVSIDDLTIIGEYTTIADSRHLRTADDVPIHHSVQTAPVSIGRNIWVGAHAVIASGVTVGDYAFVAAGAVVTRDVEPRWLVGGVPAIPIREVEVEVE